MAHNKPTIKRDSVFKFGQPQQATPDVAQEAREETEQPNVPDTQSAAEVKPALTPASANHQTSVWFSDDEIEWIDQHCQTIRRSGWRGLRRSAFVRALIQALREQPLQVAGATNEQDLVEAIKRALAK